MPTGDLLLQITDTGGNPIGARVEIDLARASGPAGAGGQGMTAAQNMGSATDLTITGIACNGGTPTSYRVRVETDHYRPYAFFQSIGANRVNTASDDVAFWVKPGDVRDIRAPGFAALDPLVQAMLANAAMVHDEAGDADLVGLAGAALYAKLGPLRKACLLNLVKKAGHVATADNCLPQIGALLICRQARIFARVDAALPERLRQSPVYKSAPNLLHDPLPGYDLTEGSFKTRDAHANLQVTFQRHRSTGQLAADIDIDESSGIEHGFEVIRNAVFNHRTNPYLIHEFLLAADPIERTLDPGYRFVF